MGFETELLLIILHTAFVLQYKIFNRVHKNIYYKINNTKEVMLNTEQHWDPYNLKLQTLALKFLLWSRKYWIQLILAE